MVSIQQVYSAFVGSFNLNVQMMREFCNVRTVEFEPRPGSLLHIQASPESTFMMPFDSVIAPHLLVHQTWQDAMMSRVKELISGRYAEVALVDVGANVGLFTRECRGLLPEIKTSFAYEPSPENFRCLKHNTAPFDSVRTENCALGPEAGVLTFHLDPDNTGNYSLNQAAMPTGSECRSIQVPVRSVAEEAREWLATGMPIFYKSDTQSYDEIIASAIGDAVWDRVFAGMMEIWCIDRPGYAIESFSAVLDAFPHKRFLGSDPDAELTTEQIVASAKRTDGSTHELLFWR